MHLIKQGTIEGFGQEAILLRHSTLGTRTSLFGKTPVMKMNGTPHPLLGAKGDSNSMPLMAGI